MTVPTRGEVADLKERAKVVNVRFSAQVVSDLVETIESLSKALDDERTHGAIERIMRKENANKSAIDIKVVRECDYGKGEV